MRVLVISDVLSEDYGWGRYAVGLISALLRHGREGDAEIRLLTPRHRARARDLRHYPDHHRVPSYRSEARGLTRVVVLSLWRALRAARGCDVIHCVTEPYAPVAALVARGRPYFVTAHGTYAVRPLTRPPDRWLMAPALRRAAGVLCVSDFTRRRILEQLPLRNTVVLPEGVDYLRFQPSADGLVPLPPQLAGRRYLLSVAVLKRRKGIDTTVRAFARLRTDFPALHYAVVGEVEDPLFAAELRREAAELGMGDCVHFLGRVPDELLLALYHGCELLWLTPAADDHQFEGFGLTYLEANACGKPVIGSLGSGAEEAIAEGESGLLVPPADADATAAAARRLLSNPAWAQEVGERGRARARAMSWDRTAALLLGHFRAAVMSGE